MKNKLPLFNGNQLIAIVFIISLTMVSLTYIITIKEGKFNLCIRENICVDISK
jgi:hypothetical protein